MEAPAAIPSAGALRRQRSEGYPWWAADLGDPKGPLKSTQIRDPKGTLKHRDPKGTLKSAQISAKVTL